MHASSPCALIHVPGPIRNCARMHRRTQNARAHTLTQKHVPRAHWHARARITHLRTHRQWFTAALEPMIFVTFNFVISTIAVDLVVATFLEYYIVVR